MKIEKLGESLPFIGPSFWLTTLWQLDTFHRLKLQHTLLRHPF